MSSSTDNASSSMRLTIRWSFAILAPGNFSSGWQQRSGGQFRQGVVEGRFLSGAARQPGEQCKRQYVENFQKLFLI